MRIIELRASGYKRLKIVAIRPEGSVVVVSGENSAGKTSVLNAIMAAIKGKAAAGPTPIRDGQDECRIKLDMGDLVVLRSFTKTDTGEITTKLSVKNADGSKPAGTPQAILDALLGNLSFDPLAFGRWPAKEQFDAVRGLVKGFDFVAHDSARQKEFEARTDQNRRHKENEAAAARVILPPGPKPEAVVISDVLAEIEKARKHNEDLTVRRVAREKARETIDAKQDEAEQLRARAATLEREADELQAKLDAAPALPDPIDVTAMNERVRDAERINAVRRDHETREGLEEAARAAKAKADEITANIEARDAAKAAAIAATKMPAGLEIIDGRVLLNGLPFSEAGTAERIRTGMVIGAALNPKLRVILCDDGSELDPKSMKIVEAFAIEHNMQVWVSSCHHDSGLAEVEIVDGEVKS